MSDSNFTAGYNETEAAPAAKPTQQAEVPDVPATEEVAAPEAIDPVKELLSRFESLEKKHEATEKTARSLAGHIGNLTMQQNKLSELLTAAKAAGKHVDDAPSNAEIKEAMASPEEWNALKEQFPEWATATEKFMDAKLANKPSIDPKTVEQMVQERLANATQSLEQKLEMKHLERQHKDWKQVANSMEFQSWLAAQPPEFQKQVNETWDADFVVDAISQFKASLAPAAPAPAPAPKPSPRQKQLEAAVNPKSVGGHPPAQAVDLFRAGYES